MTRQPLAIPPARLVEELLRQEMLSGAPAAVPRLVAVAEAFSVPRGALLFEAGQEASLYFILSGQFGVLVEGRLRASLGAGHALGEFPLILLETRHQVSARAQIESVVARVPLDEVRRVAEEFPELWRALAKSLARRLYDRNRELFTDLATTLQDWRAASVARAERHREEAARYARRNMQIGVPTAGIGFVAGSSVFLSFVAEQRDTVILVAAGILSLTAGLLSVFQTFFGFAAKAEAHNAAADGHEAVCRDVDFILGKAESLKGRGRAEEAETILEDGAERVKASLKTLAGPDSKPGDAAGSPTSAS